MKIKSFFLGVVILALAKVAHGAPHENSPQYPEGRPSEECKEAKEGLDPKQLETAKFRIDVNTGECNVINEVGDCGQNMLFLELEGNKTYGICDCDRKKSEQLLIRHEETNTCYFIFEQGYCNDGEILTQNDKSEPICEMNKCAAEKLKAKPGGSGIFVYLEKDGSSKCREVGTPGDGYCEEKHTLQFESGHYLPKCKLPREGHHAMPTAAASTCKEDEDLVAGQCMKRRTSPRIKAKPAQ